MSHDQKYLELCRGIKDLIQEIYADVQTDEAKKLVAAGRQACLKALLDFADVVADAYDEDFNRYVEYVQGGKPPPTSSNLN